jgi:release factor glutamine methyltransferase
LLAAGVDSPRLTAELLMAHALGRERSYLFAHDHDDVPGGLAFDSLVTRRAAGEPLQHITGVQEFYGRPFRVSRDVLIPRPETEHVVERALALAGGASRIVDVGAGSGAIGVTLALELSRRVVLTDVSPPALAMARANASALGASCSFVLADGLASFASASVDLIVSNPPYIPLGERDSLAVEVREHDPALALFGGESGNEIYRRILAEAPRVLRPGGWLVMELGWQSARAVRMLAGSLWTNVRVEQDLAGHDRVFSARLA